MKLAVCFTGGIASGKTTLAAAVADRLGAKRASFGQYVRSTARERGLSEDRGSLQDLGASLIAELGWDAFCRAALAAASWEAGDAIVVDGVRHVSALATIRRLVAPVATKLVFVDVPRDVREARADQRTDGTRLDRAEAHSTERDVQEALREAADLVVDGTRDGTMLVDEVMRALSG